MHWRGANVVRTGKNKIKMSEMSSELSFTFDLFCFPMRAYANSQRGWRQNAKIEKTPENFQSFYVLNMIDPIVTCLSETNHGI